jgi:hypothetical protein
MKKIAKNIVIGLLAVVSLIVFNVSPAVASNPKPYCKNQQQHNCLQPIQVAFSSECVAEGGLAHMNFSNPNDEIAPRVITVFFNGEEFFEDSGFTEPGNSSLTFGPLPNGTWEIVVSWKNLEFGRQTFNFSCTNE